MTDKSNNKRDRSKEAEARRLERNYTIDFTGENGLLRAQINHKVELKAAKKHHSQTAAKRRASKLENYFNDDKMEKARRRHKWRQKELREDI